MYARALGPRSQIPVMESDAFGDKGIEHVERHTGLQNEQRQSGEGIVFFLGVATSEGELWPFSWELCRAGKLCGFFMSIVGDKLWPFFS